MYHVRPKLCIVVFVVLLMTLYILSYVDYEMYKEVEKPYIFTNLSLVLAREGSIYGSSLEPFKEIIIHIDLKGAPPKLRFLLDFISFVKNLGATGLLLEYEDMFPYHDGLEDLKALNAYTLSDISLINELAERNNMTVIPLVQTFGHMEFVLKLEKYKSYREVATNPQALCPHQEPIIAVVEKMISQVLDAHPRSKYIHIGCDEVFNIGVCPRCQSLMKKNKWRKDDIYFLHVKKIARYIINKRPGVRPIMWGDKLNKKNEELILHYNLSEVVDAMLWNYKPDPTRYSKAIDMQSNAKVFKSIWIASAFKGSTGQSKVVTIPLKHYANNKGWMYFASQWKDKIKFKGIVLTGWQRYHHFSVLCELLPVAIPSLALSIQALTEEEGFNLFNLDQTLKCNAMPPLSTNELRDLKQFSKLECNFLGFNIYYYVHLLNNKINEAQKALDVFKAGNLFLYNVLSNFSDLHIIRQYSSRNDFKNYLDDINILEHKVRLALAKVYSQDTINEWIMTYVMPSQLRLEAAMKIFEDLSARKTWPNRPFPNSDSSVRDLFKRICGSSERKGCGFLNIF